MLENFIKEADMPQEVIEKYEKQVPAELVQIWQEDGLGTFLDGYLKVINPDDYLELLQDSYFRGGVAFPMFVTAFGDIITWEENAYVGIVQYNIQDLDIMIKRMDRFIGMLMMKISKTIISIFHSTKKLLPNMVNWPTMNVSVLFHSWH